MKISVAVIFGGKSTEHEISCISANQVINALDSDKYDVLPIYISKDSDLYISDKLFDLGNYASFISNPDQQLTKVSLYKDGNSVYVKPIKGLLAQATKIDVAFPVVHGTNVEDGTLAGYLQMLDIPFTSCDVLGGAVGQDKAVMKDIFKANSIPMVDYFTIYTGDFNENFAEYQKAANKLKYPLIAKPANLGSSIGIEIIKNAKEFKKKISECLRYDSKVVVEKMITDLKEVNISVMGNVSDAKVSVIEEVTNGFLDYSKKYNPNGGKKTGSKNASKLPSSKSSKGMASTSRKVPADLTKLQKTTIEKTALKVFKVLNSNGCVRIDFMIDKKTGKVYCNEINTIPGSLAFYLWNHMGVSFEKECDELINNAMKQYAKKASRVYSFDTNILESYKH